LKSDDKITLDFLKDVFNFTLVFLKAAFKNTRVILKVSIIGRWFDIRNANPQKKYSTEPQ